MRYVIIALSLAVLLSSMFTAVLCNSAFASDTSTTAIAEEPEPLLDGIDWDEWLEGIHYTWDGFFITIDMVWEEWDVFQRLDGIDWDEWLERWDWTQPDPSTA